MEEGEFDSESKERGDSVSAALEHPFESWPKITRLNREIIITEKIDGTNAHILIAPDCAPIYIDDCRSVPFLCASRTRYVFPDCDNHGFAAWAYGNAEELLKLGPGRHFGEWWGQGIQRHYNRQAKHFSLFSCRSLMDGGITNPVCSNVPVLYNGRFSEQAIQDALTLLREHGSLAAPHFMKPEGIVIRHVVSGAQFKVTLEKDEERKSVQEIQRR